MDVRSVENFLGTPVSYAYGVKAGPWLFPIYVTSSPVAGSAEISYSRQACSAESLPSATS